MAETTGGTFGSFPSTRWSLVDLAGRDEGPQRKVLGEFLKQYFPALRAHLVLGKGIGRDLADDLLQGFLCDKVVQDGLIAQAVKGKGRFRWFLRTALDHYIIDVLRRDTAHKRTPEGLLARLPDDSIGPAAAEEPSDPLDVAWARQVIQSALVLMESECKAAGRVDVWGVFEARILAPLDGAEPVPYDELAARFGLDSAAQAMNILVTAKRMYERNLRAVVGEYVTGPGETDAEVHDLAEILAHASR